MNTDAWKVLSYLAFQTSSYDHNKWFPDKSNRHSQTLINKPKERYYQMWEEADYDERKVIAAAYCAFSKIDKLYFNTVEFTRDMDFLERICLILGDPVKRTLLLEMLVYDHVTDKVNESLAGHLERMYQDERDFCATDKRYTFFNPIAFISKLDSTLKAKLAKIDPQDIL